MGGTHYVMAHGVCHGAWCWYKLKPLLESAGHRVTVLDLAASGTDTKRIEDVHTFSDYSQPLLEFLDSLTPNEKVVLVGHSFGGMSLALAMDRFPEKIAVGVFLAAFIPDTQNKPSYVFDEIMKRPKADGGLDIEFSSSGSKKLMIFAPNSLSTKLHPLCPIEDLELAKTKIRPGSLFIEDLSNARNFSKEGYGSVARAYIVCNEDLTIPLKDQHWMIQNAEINDVMEIKDADHMAMLSRPQELSQILLQIADKYT